MKKIALLLAAAVALAHSMPSAAVSKTVLPELAQNMSAGDVRKLYADHTWKWGTGGAYFGPDATFIAASGDGEDVSVAAGRWLVTSGGRMCFDAFWSGTKYSASRVMTCFNHAEFKGQFFQAKNLTGKWYVIKSAKTKPDDMISTIVSGDLVSCKFITAANQIKLNLNAGQLTELSRLKKANPKCAIGKKA